MRVGIGYDIHPFDPNRPLVIGGVRIEGTWGLRGHSDADVLFHAVGDACLGAACLGDLGEHFPDSDPQWRGAPSSVLLGHILGLVRGRGSRRRTWTRRSWPSGRGSRRTGRRCASGSRR